MLDVFSVDILLSSLLDAPVCGWIGVGRRLFRLSVGRSGSRSFAMISQTAIRGMQQESLE
jgi:hypothetical protein